jgi:GNAT superfamily N-acetyltransferase
MGPAHLEPAQHLSAAVAWPHRIEDWAFALALGQGLVALEDGKVVGTIAWWPFGASHATLGMIIVDPQRQGRGLGRLLIEAALAELGSRSVLLNATAEGMQLYGKMGFRATGTIRQHQGVPRPAPPAVRTGPWMLRPMRSGDLAAVVAMDGRASGLSRAHLIDALSAAGTALVLEAENGLAGFAFCRRFGRGQVIGPVVAPNADAAKTLIATWIAQNGGAFQRLDSPDSLGLSDWLSEGGLPCRDEVITMVRGTPPHPEPHGPRLFALASQALG